MAKERKYLDEFEMSLLEKYGIKILKKKYDISDLLYMLPKKWQTEDVEFGKKIKVDWGLNIEFNGYDWSCTTPIYVVSGACVKTINNKAYGDTVLECLLNAILRCAKDPIGRRYLSKTYIVEDWKYKPAEQCRLF